jgi:uncharacterized protein YbdZ (MbtH family)
MEEEDYKDWQDYRVKVVRNHEHVISIWPFEKSNPIGWDDVGINGMKEECLKWIEANCTPECKYTGPIPVLALNGNAL